jgi:hypothetical protein
VDASESLGRLFLSGGYGFTRQNTDILIVEAKIWLLEEKV